MIESQSRDLLEAALEGYQAQRSRLDTKIAGIKRQLDPPPAPTPTLTLENPATPPARPKKVLSAKVRAHMRAAQRKRWAEIRKAAEAAKPAAKKAKAK
jgi:hypothetical protein